MTKETKNGICLLPVAPIRKENTDTSEMVSQILFGETMQITDETGNWVKVILDTDGYEGWVDKKMIEIVDDQKYVAIKSLPAIISSAVILKAWSQKWNSGFLLPAGSIIRNYNEDKNEFGWEKDIFMPENLPLYLKESSREEIVQSARQFLNSPYQWGGKTCFGMDCSGFTQLIMQINGIKLPRDARQQVEKGKARSFISESLPGDLAFFDNEAGEITHTGIILAGNEIIHASGKVQIDRIDQQGIFNISLNRYTHRLRIIKNFLG